MLNIEDFKEEMIKKDGGAFGVEVATHKVLECVGFDCERCLFHGDCRRKRWDWLLSEKKPVIVLTKEENEVLKSEIRGDTSFLCSLKPDDAYTFSSPITFYNDSVKECSSNCEACERNCMEDLIKCIKDQK